MSNLPIQIPTQPQDVEQIRALLLELWERGDKDATIEQVVRLLEQMRQLNTALALRVAELLRRVYGQRSEKLDPDQLALVFAALTQTSSQTTSATAQDDPDDGATLTQQESDAACSERKPNRKKHPGRKPLAEHLPRTTVRLTPPAELLTCPVHGPKVLIGTEVSEVLELVPASFHVIRYERETWACPEGCEGQVVTAEPADKIIERGLPAAGLLSDLVVKKFRFSLPIERIRLMYRQEGVELSSSTLGGWVAATADLLEPIAKLLAQLVLEADVLGVDDTGLPVLDREHPKGIKRGHLWAYVSDGGYLFYDYTPNWSGELPRKFLSQRVGIIQGDDYKGYAALFGPGSPRVKAGCWAHVRRRFEAAEQSGDERARVALGYIALMYDTERAADQDQVGPDERRRRRQLGTRPLLEQLGAWSRHLKRVLVPGSPLAKAIDYMLKQWDDLLVFVDDGRVEPDNNWVERQMRIVAVGRKNFLFAGSDAGAARAAILYTIIGNCLLAGVDPWHYIRDVLQKLATGWPMSRLGDLLPQAWAKEHGQQGDAGAATGPPCG